jgi:very-short-patch-repair endonuclease
VPETRANHAKQRIIKNKYERHVSSAKKQTRKHLPNTEEMRFARYLSVFDQKIKMHVQHPVIGHIMDYYLPTLNLWVQYDGNHWHNQIIHSKKQENRKKQDQYQNASINNLIRFWSDDVIKAIANETILEIIVDKIKEKIPSFCSDIPPFLKQKFYKSVTVLPFEYSKVAPNDFQLSNENYSEDFKMIFDGLPTTGWFFTARHNNYIGALVHIIPYGPSNCIVCGEGLPWIPPKLYKQLLLYSCSWILKHTEKRNFIVFNDLLHSDNNKIYYQCGFNYDGKEIVDGKEVYKYVLSHTILND